MRFRRIFLILHLFVLVLSASADDLTDIGWRALTNELGVAMPTGADVIVAQVEAEVAGGFYLADTNDVDLLGLEIIDRTGSNSTPSWHGTEVALKLLGASDGVAPGVTNLFGQSAADWYGNDLLRNDTPGDAEPLVEAADVLNHSWMVPYNAGAQSTMIQISRLMDYVVWRDSPVIVMTLANDLNPIPNLMAHSYNGIVVGRQDNGHSAGTTRFDVTGRAKPDLVGPDSSTSYNAPLVSGAAALLLETARTSPDLNNADDPRAIKAILMAAANKMAVNSWTNAPTAPLDGRFGAGLLNVQEAYHLLAAGEATPGTSQSAGWAQQILASNQVHRYSFSAPDETGISALHVSLNWLREVWDDDSDPAFFNPQVEVADMTLSLYRATNGVPTVLLDRSMSPVDNVEYLYTLQLGGGEYVLEVETDVSVEYGLAWRSETVEAPSIAGFLASDGSMEIQADVEPGYAYAVEAAIPGQTWTNVVGAQVMTNAMTLIPVPTGDSEMSYRLSQVY